MVKYPTMRPIKMPIGHWVPLLPGILLAACASTGVTGGSTDTTTPLMWAAQDGDLVKARNLVATGADLNARNANGVSVLFHTSFYKRAAVARYLIENGARPANENERIHIVEMLRDAGMDPGTIEKLSSPPSTTDNAVVPAPLEAGSTVASLNNPVVNIKQRVLVLRLKAVGKVSPDVCRMVTHLILTRLDDVRGLSTIGEEDIQAMMYVEKGKDLLGCDTATCMAEIGGALGADLVVHGELGQLGTQYNVNLSIVESKAASVRGRVSALVDANEDAVVKELPSLISKIVEKINAGTDGLQK